MRGKYLQGEGAQAVEFTPKLLGSANNHRPKQSSAFLITQPCAGLQNDQTEEEEKTKTDTKKERIQPYDSGIISNVNVRKSGKFELPHHWFILPEIWDHSG